MLEAWWVPFSEVVRNFGLLAAAIVGVVLGAFWVIAANRQAEAALRQAELARRAHVAELFNQAVGQLEGDKLHIRLGAIYALREISRDFPDLTKAVLELLFTYLRERSPDPSDALPAADIREIMRIVRERIPDER